MTTYILNADEGNTTGLASKITDLVKMVNGSRIEWKKHHGIWEATERRFFEGTLIPYRYQIARIYRADGKDI